MSWHGENTAGKVVSGSFCFWGGMDNNPLPLPVWLTDHALTFWQLNEEHPCTEVSIPLQKWEISNWKSELSELIYKLQHFYCPIISAVFFSTNGVRAITTYFLDNFGLGLVGKSWTCREISVLHFFSAFAYLWDLGLLQGLIIALCKKVVSCEKDVKVTDFLSAVRT